MFSRIQYQLHRPSTSFSEFCISTRRIRPAQNKVGEITKQIAEKIAAHSRLSASDALNSILTIASCRLQRHQGATLTRRYLGF